MPQIDITGSDSKIAVDKIQGQSATTVTIPTGHKINSTDATGIEVAGTAVKAGDWSIATQIAPSTSGNVLTSSGSAWASTAPAGGGKILQVVNTTNNSGATGATTLLNDDSIPQSSEGTEYMTLAITPAHANNKLVIQVVFCHACSLNSVITMALFQDSTAGALAAVHNWEAGNIHSQLLLTHYMTAGTTSATTFKLRAGCESGGTVTFNGINAGRRLGGVSSSGITIFEISA